MPEKAQEVMTGGIFWHPRGVLGMVLMARCFGVELEGDLWGYRDCICDSTA